jgi:hypothetical protein
MQGSEAGGIGEKRDHGDGAHMRDGGREEMRVLLLWWWREGERRRQI